MAWEIHRDGDRYKVFKGASNQSFSWPIEKNERMQRLLREIYASPNQYENYLADFGRFRFTIAHVHWEDRSAWRFMQYRGDHTECFDLDLDGMLRISDLISEQPAPFVVQSAEQSISLVERLFRRR